MKIQCYNCQTELLVEIGQKIGRHDDCHKCNRGMRCCKMCQFYDINSYNECNEPLAERILDKEKVNFCDHFNLGFSSNSKIKSKEDILASAQALFKK
jgi:hypothetical protein